MSRWGVLESIDPAQAETLPGKGAGAVRQAAPAASATPLHRRKRAVLLANHGAALPEARPVRPRRRRLRPGRERDPARRGRRDQTGSGPRRDQPGRFCGPSAIARTRATRTALLEQARQACERAIVVVRRPSRRTPRRSRVRRRTGPGLQQPRHGLPRPGTPGSRAEKTYNKAVERFTTLSKNRPTGRRLSPPARRGPGQPRRCSCSGSEKPRAPAPRFRPAARCSRNWRRVSATIPNTARPWDGWGPTWERRSHHAAAGPGPGASGNRGPGLARAVRLQPGSKLFATN